VAKSQELKTITTKDPNTIDGGGGRKECDPLFTAESRSSAIAKLILTLTAMGRNNVSGH
jgi:hypothetical protein